MPETSNQYEPLSLDPDPNDSLPPLTDSPTHGLGRSSHQSTPSHKVRGGRKRTKATRIPLRILNINCQSVKSKVPQLHNLIESIKPDVVIGTESWLKPNVHSSECFPPPLHTLCTEKTEREQVVESSSLSSQTSLAQR